LRDDGVRVELSDLQGIVPTAYPRPAVRHLLLSFGAADAGRAFLDVLTPRVRMGAERPGDSDDPLINVGLSVGGLTALGVEQSVLSELDPAFEHPPDPLELGDRAGRPGDPATWWGGRFTTAAVHCVIHVYCLAKDGLDAACSPLRELAAAHGLTELIALDCEALPGRRVHFGYQDGISRVDVAWDDAARTEGKLDFRNFVLGHSTRECSSKPDSGEAAALLKGSTYGVFRWLHQDVAAFNRFLAAEGPALYPQLSPADAEELLAAKLVGRWRDGTPLVLAPDAPDAPLSGSDDFTFEHDPEGRRCPFASHIRVMNPRGQALDAVIRDGVPRVLRRGMPYGPVLEGMSDDRRDRGLIGIFLCANIRRQVYALAGWADRADFSPVFADPTVQDALVGNRAPGSNTSFTVPGGARPIPQLPQFVHAKGTVLLLYPGAATLRQLAA
jgi:deferrochelatase/peroxidase EfeB